jgi:gluconate 5-dehydrogenase
MSSYIEKKFGLNGKVVIVSGASRGIGNSIASGLAKSGATVIGLGRTKISKKTDKFSFDYQPCDVSDSNKFELLCKEIFKKNNRIDGYIHVAGITNPNDDSLENFKNTININLTSTFSCCQTIGKIMMEKGSGSIVNITSIGSELGFPNNPSYGASKGGVRILSKSLALDFGSKNIRVNNIAPGYIHTDMTDKSFQDPKLSKERSNRTILNRWGVTEDIVGSAIFLISDASKYITGIDLFVDGGWTAKGL